MKRKENTRTCYFCKHCNRGCKESYKVVTCENFEYASFFKSFNKNKRK